MMTKTNYQPRKSRGLQPVLPLVPIKSKKDTEDKTRTVAFELKTRARTQNNESKYKKYVKKFEEGNPQEWIALIEDLKKIFLQNLVNNTSNRISLWRGGSRT